ncbi:hypothetical protein ACWOAH_00735 [Vagococcus vulneris]|uniref:Glycosyltransferase RgtA/B/C/D-like domain-containing protein n=1 Tax=Vagococcus vulneris TaxID=1977869 RepID=A0A430A2D6_9ENTE|nr:hypothetical protein [Vagococcus vulneris]RSU00585.1 hypothetical protein CBF37_00805 [Vagococcus vulneris]
MRSNNQTIRKWKPSLGMLLFLVFFLTSAIFLLIASKNSPIYRYNDWVDLNAFLTMGKSWGHGKIPYRDLFEQKGPLLYLVFMIASKLSPSYHGIYFLEVVNLAWVSMLLFKTARFYLDKSKSLVFVFLSYTLLLMSPFFKMGGSAEEFAFVPVVFLIYLIVKLQHTDYVLTNRDYILAGLGFSYLFWVKFTMVGGYLGFYIALFIILLLKKRTYQAVNSLVWFLLMFIVVSMLIVAYFSVLGGLNQLIFNYFYANISLYPNNETSGLIGNILNAVRIFSGRVIGNQILTVTLGFGLAVTCLTKRLFSDYESLFIYCATFFTLIISTFYGGKDFSYYFLILMPFACLSILWALTYVKAKTLTEIQWIFTGLLSLILVFGLNGNFKYSTFFPNNRSLTFNTKDHSFAQEKFARIMNKEKEPTLLNYGALDEGFYQAANIVPTVYYFERQNISDEYLPEMMETQNKAVDNKTIKFVVCRINFGETPDKAVPENIQKNYDLVADHSQFAEWDKTYLLYKAKN